VHRDGEPQRPGECRKEPGGAASGRCCEATRPVRTLWCRIATEGRGGKIRRAP
jgi:hypothetical protein